MELTKFSLTEKFFDFFHKKTWFTLKMIYLIQNAFAERWLSGRKQQFAKLSYGKPYRGFESRPLRHFFCQKKWRTKTQVFSSLCEAQLHSKGAAFSSHLHQTPEKTYLLVHRSLVRRWMKSLPLVACEEGSLRCPWSCRLSAGGCVTFYCASLKRRQSALIFCFAMLY